jgi:hypothetical protein
MNTKNVICLLACLSNVLSAYAETLPPTTEAPDEILITAKRLPAPISKQTLSGQDIRQLAGSSGDPLNALQTLPGVATVEGSSTPAVRGSGPGDNLYYVDGLQVNNVFHFGSLSVFNAGLIDSFNLYSSVLNPHYGDITGAVIDVKLREPRSDHFAGNFDVSLMGAGFLLEGPRNNTQSYYFAGRRSYIDLLVKQVTQDGVTVQIPSYSDYQGKYVWQLGDDNRLIFHAMGASDALKLNISTTANTARLDPVLGGDSSFADQNAMQAATLETLLSGGTLNTLSFEHGSDHLTTLLGTAGTLNINTSNLMLREKISLALADDNELTLATDFLNSATQVNASLKNATCTQFNPNCTFTQAPLLRLNDVISTSLWSISAQDRKRVLPNLTLIGGLRYSTENYAHQSYSEPRVGLEWAWSTQTLLTAGWGRHNQTPTSQEWARVFGNPNLSHLRSQDSMLGIQHTINADWNWKAETYYKKLDNLVVNDPLLNYINAASGKAYGLELLLKKEQSERLSGWLVINLAKSERRNDVTGESFRYQFDQPINTTLVSNYALSDDLKLGMKWAYHSGTPFTPIIGTNGTYANGSPIPFYGAVNSATLPAYHRLDLRLDNKVTLNGWKLNAYVELNNFYQHKNIVGYNYNSNYTARTPIYAFVLPLSFGVQGDF